VKAEAMDKTDHVLNFIMDLKSSDIPAVARHQAKRCFLDAMGAMIAGTQTPVARLMAGFAAANFAGDDSTIILNGCKASPVGAALANGYAANALDLDDGFRLVKGHPGACTLPVLIAAGEIAKKPLAGGEFLTALIVGYEVAIRAGLIRHALSTTVHASGSWGAIGGAALTGRLLGLGRRELREALGVAEHHAPISNVMKALDKPCNGKDSVGWGAMVGISSALMAREGFSGVNPLFDESPDSSWVEGLGSEYFFLNLYFKPHAACRWAQPAIMGAMRLFRDYNLTVGSIASIEIKTFKAAAALSNIHPTDTEEAQYNMAYPVAAALVDGEVGPHQVRSPRIFDPAILSVADRVRVEVKEEFENAFPQKTIAEVTIVTTDGRQLESGPVEPKWEPPLLPSDEELEQKFVGLVAPVLGEKKCRRLAELAWGLDQIESIRQIMDACLRD
jgi:2-methylcitrate dehydratase PrpD